MTDNKFEFQGKQFQLRKIDAFRQFHIVRRIAPILADLLPAMKDIQAVEKNSSSLSESEKLDEFAKIAAPLMMGISKLNDADADFVLHGLLYSAEMQQDTGNWIKVSNGSMLMAQNLELPALLQIAGRAFMYNLSGFFGALPPRS